MFHPTLLSRRDALKTTACGFGYLALAGLLQQAAAQETGAAASAPGPVAPRSPHFAPRAKRVIFLFMQGGPSHVDTFDYKPKLQADAGKRHGRGTLLPSPFEFKRRGQSGLYVSELFENVARHADDLCLLNGMHCDNPAHPQATVQLHTGSTRFVRPSVGSWVLYGLGTLNSNLPGFITINPTGGAQNYGAGFLPAAFEGTRIDGNPRRSLPNLANPSLTAAQQRRQLDLVQSMNADLLKRTGQNGQIEGLIESYELGFRMQSAVPDVMDLSKESDATRGLYGIGGGLPSDAFGRQCLLARRYAEAGVRFIEVSHNGWDQHNNLVGKLKDNCAATDRPIAALLTDLKQRGMLDETLVVWGGEFGRTPTNQGQKDGRDGRDHNNRGYTMWLAGGGTKGGVAHGATDDYGAESVAGKVHVHDLHATILHLLGLDHERLTYRYAGRDFRLTDVYGNVVRDVVA